jgi:hypothetical protein
MICTNNSNNGIRTAGSEDREVRVAAKRDGDAPGGSWSFLLAGRIYENRLGHARIARSWELAWFCK